MKLCEDQINFQIFAGGVKACVSDCWLMGQFAMHEKYRGADKSLARPGRKQATATEDFDVHVSYL